MKKTYVQINGDSTERFALYVGVDGVDGGWLLETNGGAVCLNSLEAIDHHYFIEDIKDVIASADTCWEDCDERDEEYVNGTLEAWGLK